MGVAILISNKIDFKLKLVKRDEEVHFIFITGKVHQDEVSILSIYAPNTSTPSFVKETLLKPKLHFKPLTLIVGDFNRPLSPLDRSVRQKINREIKELTDVMTQMDLTDIFRTFHPNTQKRKNSQQVMQLSLKLTIYLVTKQINRSKNLE